MTSRNKRRPISHPQSNAGMSLLEVLIAVLVLAIGLLGVAALQAAALRNSHNSLGRSQAVIESYAMLDAIRAAVPSTGLSNPQAKAAALDAYDLARTCATPTANTTLAQKDVRLWIDALQTNIAPGSCGTIDCASSVCTVTVEWDESRSTEGSQTYQIATRSQM
jgi:type IV pilus assembly protein PilV